MKVHFESSFEKDLQKIRDVSFSLLMHPILQNIPNLSPQDQQQIINLISTLLKKHQKRSVYLKQTWAGALRDYRSTYTSLSLQQETINNWANDVSN
jgi:mRNA-degrading endonuclease YafQ of YafQ-DinJ toxin-antitoxin module